jgi:phenylalanyl-tRNA synthetase beta chain
MNVSFEWLSSLVDLSSLTPQAVASALIQAGIEVEDVIPFAQATHLTTGKVLSKFAVEGSTHLHQVTVDTAQHGIRSIVCGAPNIDVGQTVIVALPGAKLPGGMIQESTIRGVASQGMVCALNELGIPPKFLRKDQIEGIEVLPSTTPLGDDDILAHLGYEDTIFVVKLLANRPDLLSMENFAKEVAAVCDVPLLPQAWQPMVVHRQPATLSLKVEHDFISQFSLQVLTNIQPAQTPQWLKTRLMKSGIRPISFFVDIGNYVMLLTGQPLHMYDVNKLPSSALTVGQNPASSFVALDQQTYDLKPEDLHISSQGDVMCLAGVMGSLACAVDDSTTTIAIEAASFHPTSIRKTALRLNLISESSQRFAKGIYLGDSQRVLDYTEFLIASLTTIGAYQQRIQFNPNQAASVTVEFEPSRINGLLGTSFSDKHMIDTLNRLGIQYEEGTMKIPPHRVDIKQSADLAEEIIRLSGFDTMASTPRIQPIQAGGYSEVQQKRRRIKEVLRSLAFQECLTYTLVDEHQEKAFQILDPASFYRIKNPLSDEKQVVRTSGLKSLLDVAIYNVSRQTTSGQLFEWALMSRVEGPQERLTIVWYGERYEQSLLAGKPVHFYDIKGVIETILGLLYIEPSRVSWEPLREYPEILHPGRSSSVKLQGETVGVFGELSPIAQEKLGFGKTAVVVMELNMQALMEIKTSSIRLQDLAKYPSVTRDLACVVKQEVPFASLVKTIKKAGKAIVQSVDVFDIYQGDHVAKGYQSLALRIKLLDRQKTLLDSDILHTIDLIKAELIKNHAVEFRG